MTRRELTETIVSSMRILAAELLDTDDVGSLACTEAADRLEELMRDIAVVLPAISMEAAGANPRSKAGREFRAAANRLAAEVLV